MKIGEFEINRNSKNIAVSIFSNSTGNLMENFRTGKLPLNRLYEIRYDLFDEHSSQDLEKLLMGLNSLGISYIFTFRGPASTVIEYSGIADTAKAPAIDLDHTLTGEFRSVNSVLISSLHLYDRRPDNSLLEELLSDGSDMAKLAVMYHDMGDFIEDLALVSEIRKSNEKPFAFVPMGEKSGDMRIASLLLVSDLAYARADSRTAEGQPLYEEYMDIIGH